MNAAGQLDSVGAHADARIRAHVDAIRSRIERGGRDPPGNVGRIARALDQNDADVPVRATLIEAIGHDRACALEARRRARCRSRRRR